jgi:hypothetical protein
MVAVGVGRGVGVREVVGWVVGEVGLAVRVVASVP